MSIVDYLVALLFGIVEGITEWLPVSSTGHMIILDKICKLNVSEDFFSLYLVVIQLGAILAVVVLFWNDLWPFGKKNNSKPLTRGGLLSYVDVNKFQMWFKIVIACIPAGIVGVFFDDILDVLLYNYIVVAIALIVFGILFIVTETVMKNKEPRCKDINDLSYMDALLIGFFQLIAAIFPGTSRSGSTIVGSLMIGISREVAAKFTFFLAVPVMLGASLLKIVKYDGTITNQEFIVLAIGMVSAFIISLFILKFIIGYVRKHDFKVFGWYRIVLGILVIIAFKFILK
ncbi:MAG: undecaprenyl-diphosphate phosphatase [Clostridia bacterium]|nr:undecaprenyl-diphosphate phosphatase [Clostridia bacterium]